jgi:Flp pilus assembly protein TadG
MTPAKQAGSPSPAGSDGAGASRRVSDRGSATVELAVLAPALLALLGLVIVAGRITVAAGAVEQAAATAAREASLARDARAARAGAQRSVSAALAQQGISCQTMSSRVDVAGFGVDVGSPATVTVEVDCSVALSDLSVPGMPGVRTVSARMTSPIDRFRGRS